VHDIRQPELRRLRHRSHGPADVRELLDDDRVGQVAEIHAAVEPGEGRGNSGGNIQIV
jgi:hypothetical protein